MDTAMMEVMDIVMMEAMVIVMEEKVESEAKSCRAYFYISWQTHSEVWV